MIIDIQDITHTNVCNDHCHQFLRFWRSLRGLKNQPRSNHNPESVQETKGYPNEYSYSSRTNVSRPIAPRPRSPTAFRRQAENRPSDSAPESAIRELCSSIHALATSTACLASTLSMASRSGDRVRERQMTGAKSISQLKVMLTAFLQNASRHSHLRLSVRQQFGLAIMPTVVVLLMVGCVQALRNQPLIFTSLASSAFLVYLDPEHPTNRVRTFLIAQGSAALLGFGSVSLLGPGFLAPGVALVLTIVLIITLDAMHPPAMSTALSFAFRTSSLKTLAIFGVTMVVIASLVALQKAAFWLVQKAGPPPSMYK